MADATSQWPSHLPALATLLVAVAGLLGWWLNRKRQPAEIRVLDLQADLHEAAKGKTRAETEKILAEKDSLAVQTMEKALVRADLRIEQLERDCATWKEHAGNAEVALGRMGERLRDEEKENARMREAIRLYDEQIRAMREKGPYPS